MDTTVFVVVGVHGRTAPKTSLIFLVYCVEVLITSVVTLTLCDTEVVDGFIERERERESACVDGGVRCMIYYVYTFEL